MKPSEFNHLRVISGETPYQAQAGRSEDESQTASGTLEVGRCVWTRQTPGGDSAQALVQAYVEGIGIISLNLHSVFPDGPSSAETFH